MMVLRDIPESFYQNQFEFIASCQGSSLDDFLIERKANPTNHFVLGNDAGDADSIISAITLAYIESILHKDDWKNNVDQTPVVTVPKDSFIHQRPDVNLLLQLAGIHDLSNKLLFLDDLKDILENNTNDGNNEILRNRSISLVDHNTLNKSLRHFQKNLIVTEIVDHHKDEKQYKKTCSSDRRNIAFDHGHALVASTATLVAERLQEHSAPYPSSIGILLLGVILLDSVNLDDSVGKVTERDRDAVNDLLLYTDWKNAISSSYIKRKGNGAIMIDTNELFKKLQHAKYDLLFWDELSVTHALAYDYKEEGHTIKFGISSILMPGLGFMSKDKFYISTLEFMESKQISFLGIMFAFYDEQEEFNRQLAFVSSDEMVDLRESLGGLLASSTYKHVGLQLKEVHIPAELNRSVKLQVCLFDQNNLAPSRKQIGPMLEDYFDEVAIDGIRDRRIVVV